MSQDIVNVEGGAIARGRPIGAIETALTARFIHSERRDGFEPNIVALCSGGGEDIGLVLETIA